MIVGMGLYKIGFLSAGLLSVPFYMGGPKGVSIDSSAEGWSRIGDFGSF
jgi:hypothetical protein